MQGQQRAQSTQLSGMLILCMAVTPPQQPLSATCRSLPAAASQSPVRMNMSWREFSHGTWHRVHTYYAGTDHARGPAGAEYASQRDDHTVHGGDPATAASATCQSSLRLCFLRLCTRVVRPPYNARSKAVYTTTIINSYVATQHEHRVVRYSSIHYASVALSRR